jgi:hypothetical protein
MFSTGSVVEQHAQRSYVNREVENNREKVACNKNMGQKSGKKTDSFVKLMLQ